MEGANQYIDKDEFQSPSIFFEVKDDLYEEKTVKYEIVNKVERQTQSAIRVVPRYIRPY